jgi:hypothetical protein
MAASRALAADTYNCSWEEHWKDGGSRSVDVTITANKGEVTALDVMSSTATGQEGGGYLCEFDSSSRSYATTISHSKSGTTFHVTETGHESTFNVRNTRHAFLIQIDSSSYPFCGFGAEFPELVELSHKSHACKVNYERR